MYPLDVAERLVQGSAALHARQQDLDVERGLVEAARSNPVAFGTLYERHVDGLYSYIYRRVGNRMVTEDLVGETFAHALAYLPRYEWRGIPFSCWLYRIAANHVATHYRRGTRMAGEDALGRIVASAHGPEQVLARMEWSEETLAAVRALPAAQQQVIDLRFGRELHNREIGRVMQRSERAVKALLHRALRSLQRSLAANGSIRRGTRNTGAQQG